MVLVVWYLAVTRHCVFAFRVRLSAISIHKLSHIACVWVTCLSSPIAWQDMVYGGRSAQERNSPGDIRKRAEQGNDLNVHTHTTTAVKHDSRQIQGKRAIYGPTPAPAPPWWNNLLPRTFVGVAHGDFFSRFLDFSIFWVWSSAEN